MTDQMRHTLNTYLTVISSTLSIIGCLIIFAAHRAWSECRSNSRKILLYITAADFLTAFGLLIGINTTSQRTCVVQSFITTMSTLTSFFWTSCLALYLHAVSVSADSELGRKIMFVFHCLGWPIPFVVSLIALLSQALGPSKDYVATGDWCWIKTCTDPQNCSATEYSSRVKPVLWLLFAGKFWEILSYAIIVIAYIRIWSYVREHRHRVEDYASSTVTPIRAVERRTIMIPVSFLIIRIWGTIRFFMYATGCRMDQARAIEYLQAFGDGCQGFVNAVLFCFMTEKVTKFFCKCCTSPAREKENLLEEKKEKYGAANNIN